MARLGCSPDAVDEFGERSEDVTPRQAFLESLENCFTNSEIHDCLAYGGGASRDSVAFWKLLEYLPFQRMDLHEGKWKAVRW